MLGKDMMYLLIRQGEMVTDGEVDTEESVQVKKKTNKMPAPKTPLEQLRCEYVSDSEHEDTVASSPSRASKRRKISDWPDPSMHGSVRGFISFMFTHDDPPHEDREVLYIYEIHLHERLRGGGLGSKLIKFAENAAKECGISKTMLTVFSNNTAARGVYEKLGYVEDACSPEDKIVRHRVIQADYVIMSKELI
jgi:ribosomal protein S18 acetylase RimI-like enzyme